MPLVVALAAVCACRPGPVSPPAPEADACLLGGPTPGPSAFRAGTLVVAVPGAIDPTVAPLAGTEAERIVFRQLYQPLIELGCDGTVRPGLARAWRPSDGGRTWVFTLRSDARFWDGVPVTAADVRNAWSARDTVPLAPWAGSLAGGVAAVDETTLVVRLDAAAAAVPGAFADPRLAVVKRVPGLAAPLGTGRYWLDATAPAPAAAPVAGQSGPVLVFTPVTGDPRDALDSGADVVVTDDPAAVAYAETRPELTAIALPWDRSYVLLGAWSGDSAPDGAALAQDAVRAEARAAALPDWWTASARCAARSPGGEPDGHSSGLIAYRRDDPVARALAERLVAIAGGGARAAGYGAAELEAALRRGDVTATVVALPRMVFDPCLARRRLDALSQSLPDGVLPLVDVRRRMIVRQALSGVYLDWDGVPRWR